MKIKIPFEIESYVEHVVNNRTGKTLNLSVEEELLEVYGKRMNNMEHEQKTYNIIFVKNKI